VYFIRTVIKEYSERRGIMNKQLRRFVAMLLTVVTLLGALPTAAVAQEIAELTTAAGAENASSVMSAEESVEEPAEEPAEESVVEPAEEPAEEEILLPPVGDDAETAGSAPVFRFDSYKTLEDFGISMPAAFSLRRGSASGGYLNPQTIRPNSSLYGYQWIANRTSYRYPFTASFTLDEEYMPQNSVYIAIANYDCDELSNRNSGSDGSLCIPQWKAG
jgi:hypothetical protein